MVLSKRAMYCHFPTGKVPWNQAAVPRHVHGLVLNLVMHMIQNYLYSAWLNIWLTAILPRFQGASICRPAPPISSRARPRVKICAIAPEKKGRPGCYAKLLTAQEVFQPIPGLGWTSISGSTWCKENGELQLLAVSCKETCSCEPWLRACRASVGCMCTHFATASFSDCSTQPM